MGDYRREKVEAPSQEQASETTFDVDLTSQSDSAMAQQSSKSGSTAEGLVPVVDLFDSSAASTHEATAASATDGRQSDLPDKKHDIDEQNQRQQGDNAQQRDDQYPGSAEYREDGSIERSTRFMPDGSTQVTEYHDPANEVPIGTPEHQTVMRPDGSSSYTNFNPDGSRQLIQSTDRDGNVTTFNRGEDGNYDGHYRGQDGSIGSGRFDENLNPISTLLTRPDGGQTRIERNAQGEETTTITSTNGFTDITRRDAQGNTLGGETRRPDGSRTEYTNTPDGERRDSFAPGGNRIGSIVIPPMSNGSVSQLSDGGYLMSYRAPDGSPSRQVRTDANGNTLTEQSFYPGGQLRESILYGADGRSRSVMTYDTNGTRTRTRMDEPARPPYYGTAARR